MTTPILAIKPSPEQLITVKVFYEDCNRRFKLPLNDLKAQVFPQKVSCLHSSPDRTFSPPPSLITITMLVIAVSIIDPSSHFPITIP